MTSFIAKTSELLDRFDPKYVLFARRSASFRYPAVRLGALLSEPTEYGAAEAGIERVSESQPRYVRITDTDENGMLLSGLGATAENIDPAYFLTDGDLLFARSGTVGRTYLHEAKRVDYPCFYAGYLIRFRFSDAVLPKYVFAFTQTPYYRAWVNAVQRVAVQPNINAQEYRSLVIPLPPMSVQEEVVAELDAAYAAKRAADERATALLASIDDMVLQELGIARLPRPDTSLAARMFTVSAAEVNGGRLDSRYYSPHFSENENRLCKSGVWRLGEVVELSRQQWDQRHWPNGGGATFPYVEIGAISVEDGEIGRMGEIEVVKAPSRAKMLVEKGDLLVSLTRPTRRAIAFVPEKAVASTGFAVIRKFSNDVMPAYLFNVLRSELCIYQFDKRSTGGNYPAITEEQLLRCEIPRATMAVQERIARKASEIRAEVRGLKASAAAALESAKGRIEGMLIGKEAPNGV